VEDSVEARLEKYRELYANHFLDLYRLICVQEREARGELPRDSPYTYFVKEYLWKDANIQQIGAKISTRQLTSTLNSELSDTAVFEAALIDFFLFPGERFGIVVVGGEDGSLWRASAAVADHCSMPQGRARMA
jgi:hypothetical protein